MAISLQNFEKIDGLLASFLRFGDFMECGDPRGYIRASNVLYDACIDAIGYDAARAYPSAQDCALDLVTRGLTEADFVMDEAA